MASNKALSASSYLHDLNCHISPSENKSLFSIDGLGFFSDGCQTRPPRMLNFFSGGKGGGSRGSIRFSKRRVP